MCVAKDIPTLYKDAIREIRTTILTLDLAKPTRANEQAVLSTVVHTIAVLNEMSSDWVAKHLPAAIEKVTTLNEINESMVASVIADTQADLLAVTQNIERRARMAVRQVFADSMRSSMFSGKEISADTLKAMRKTLSDAVSGGIITTDGQRWKPEGYVDALIQRKFAEAERQAIDNDALIDGR